MSKLKSISSNSVIREFAQRTAQETTSAIADFIAPTVPVATSLGRYKLYTDKTSLKIPDTRRAIGGRATVIAFEADEEEYDCQHHALDFPVDYLEMIEAGKLENPLKEGARICAQVGAISHEKRVVDLALEATGVGSALDVSAEADVIDEIDEAILQVVKAARFGALINVGIVFGSAMWRALKNHPSVRNRFVAGGAKQFSNPSLKDLGEMLMATPEARLSLLCYDIAPVGIAPDVKFIMENDMLIFARMKEPTRFDPSFMKTFRLDGQWMVSDSYTRNDGRVEVAKFDWSADVKVTNSAAAVRKTIGG